ncbi:hypothetical protein O3P69_003314 [Scylla paramamosain]|uniref:Uncharacterized protein n=1 Tax=Scylla paramamosain TaxID=85552 RepID=A0AAW0UK66_SCYPA
MSEVGHALIAVHGMLYSDPQHSSIKDSTHIFCFSLKKNNTRGEYVATTTSFDFVCSGQGKLSMQNSDGSRNS